MEKRRLNEIFKGMKKIEHPVNQPIEFPDVTIIPKDIYHCTNGCYSCIFRNIECDNIPCIGEDRKDELDVVFTYKEK